MGDPGGREGVCAQRGSWLPFRTLQPASNSQRPSYDYLPIYNLFPSYGPNNPDPDGATFACGMLWARTLWDIRRVLGYDIADALVLAGMVLNAGLQSELETPAETIIHADAYIGGRSHESALRLIFCSRGIMADAPINDLVTFQLAGKTVVIAAAEQTVLGSSGCLIAIDNLPAWLPLGVNGPQQVVTLAAAAGQNQASIWAAGERQAPNRRPTIYRYDLDGALDLGKPWNLEPLDTIASAALLDGLDIVSLAAMPKPNTAAAHWLFIGTERGLYHYDTDAGTVVVPALNVLPQDTPIFGLALFQDSANPARTLLAVAYEDGLVALDPANLTPVAAYTRASTPDYTLSVAADPAQAGHLWAGLASGGAFHFDPAAGQWQPIAGSTGPIFQILGPQTLAGTNDGLYGLQNAVWQPFNQVPQNQEAIEGTSVVSLCQAGNTLYAGTAQRGVWSRSANTWQRITIGLPRVGQLVDQIVPAGVNRQFDGNLAPAAPHTYVLYVPMNAAGAPQNITCNLTAGAGSATVKLFYIAESIDLGQQQWAGVQGPFLVGSGTVAAPAGYYLIAVEAAQFVHYTFTIDVALV